MADMTRDEMQKRLKDVNDELERLNTKAEERGDLDEKDENYYARLVTEAERLDRDIRAIDRELALARVQKSKVLSGARKGHTEEPTDDRDDEPASTSGRFKNPWDLSEVRTFNKTPGQIAGELRGRALSAIEQMDACDDKRREVMSSVLERWDDKHSTIAQLALTTSSRSYVNAFGKLISNRGNMALLEPDELEAVQRAMSLTDAEGGFLVPFQLDPSIINTADGTFNQVRQVARHVIATGDVWNGVSSGGVTSRWAGEGTEANDDAPALAQPNIPVHKLDIFVPISIEALQDAQNVAQEVGEMIAFEKDERESTAFVSGTGTGQPTGIVTALSGTASSINSATAATFAVGDVYALDEGLPARYRQRASWLAHRATYNGVRQFDTQGGASLWERLSEDVPGLLLGKRAYEAETMDSGTATGDEILVFGDFRNYVIADRIGTTVEFIPHVFGTNNRPTGQRGWYAYARVGADSVNDGGFRLLTIA